MLFSKRVFKVLTAKCVVSGRDRAYLPSEIPVEVRCGWVWIRIYGASSGVRQVNHGLSGITTVGIALEVIMGVEETLTDLALQDFRVRSLAVWSLVVVNGTIVA